MKQSFLVIFYIFMLAACSAYNHIDTNEKNGLKTMRLVQSLKGSFLDDHSDLTKPLSIKLNARYLYEEKTPQRPVVTFDLKMEKADENLADSIVLITLDGEDIPLPSLNGQSLIAENLWVPVIHSQNIQYKLNFNHRVMVLSLNEKQKYQLIKFFHRAIKYRDDIFPAIPPGQKKW